LIITQTFEPNRGYQIHTQQLGGSYTAMASNDLSISSSQNWIGETSSLNAGSDLTDLVF
jgi:hypothetical protein